MMLNRTHNIGRIVVGLLFVFFFGVRELAAQSCYLPFIWENRSRHVYGSVNVECGGCAGHTPPWGNWGVDSPWGSRTNDTQFMGWKTGVSLQPCWEDILNKPEWNSCTDSYGDAYYYNWASNTEQYSGTVKNYAAYSVTWTQCPVDWNDDGVIDDGGCGDGTGWRHFSHGGQYMKLYELDAPCCDSLVTQLNYTSSFDIDVWCDGWSCNGDDSGWQLSSSDPAVAAEIHVRTPGATWSDPNNCCLDGVNYCE